MEGKNPISKYVIVSIIILAVGLPAAYAITITLGGDPVIINGILDLMGNRITNVGTPTASTDAATKAYVDSAPGTDTLALLGCAADQVARFDGNNWVCSTISTISLNLVTLDSTNDVGADTSIAIGSDNFPVISYNDLTNGDLKLVHCKNVLCSGVGVGFDTPVTLDSEGGVGQFTSIVIGSDNFPVISYRDLTNTALKLVHCTNTSCSSFNTPVTLDSGGVGTYTSITIGSDNFPVISYNDLTNGDLKLVHCKNVSCSGGVGVGFDTPVTLDSGGVGLFTSIAIGSDNFPVISYNDETNGDLKLVHCTNTSCSSFNAPVTLDSADIVGTYTSIAIGSDNFPVISYNDLTNSDLKLVHCKNVSCTGGVGVGFDTPVTLDSEGGVGQYTSIAIDSDNFPVISYRDETNTALKLVHCTNVSCSGGVGVGFDTPITLDSVGNVGQFTSIAIGFGNFPVISYNDGTNGDLKFAGCTVQGDCTSSVIIFE